MGETFGRKLHYFFQMNGRKIREQGLSSSEIWFASSAILIQNTVAEVIGQEIYIIMQNKVHYIM